MNWLDLVILLIVGASTAMGLKIGMIRAILTALAIFVGSILGVQLSGDIDGLFGGIDLDSTVARVISYAIVISLGLVVAAIASGSSVRAWMSSPWAGQISWPEWPWGWLPEASSRRPSPWEWRT